MSARSTSQLLGSSQGLRTSGVGAAVRLALVFSTLAALATLAIDAVGSVAPGAWVAVVAAIGFTTSWVLSGRAARQAVPAAHRISVIPLHQRVG
jgi:hypothetical protein